jgi:hypothetical protein
VKKRHFNFTKLVIENKDDTLFCFNSHGHGNCSSFKQLETRMESNDQSTEHTTSSTTLLSQTQQLARRIDEESFSSDLVRIRQPSLFASRTGHALAGLFAVGTGITGIEAFGKSIAGIPFYIGAPILFGASTIANYKMLNREVISLLTSGANDFFKSDQAYLPPIKFFELLVGLSFSAVFGTGIGVLTREAILSLPERFSFFSALGVWLEIPADVLAVVTFFCISSLMTKTIADLVKSKHLTQKIARLSKKLFAEKSYQQTICLAASIIFLTSLTLFIVMLGQSQTLEACADSQTRLLENISEHSTDFSPITNLIFTRIGALLIQLPFALKTIVKPTLPLLIKHKQTTTLSVIMPNDNTIQPVEIKTDKPSKFLLACSLITSVGSGFLALSGKTLTTLTALGAIGSFINTFAASFGNNLPEFVYDNDETLEPSNPMPVTPFSTHALLQVILPRTADQSAPTITDLVIDILESTDESNTYIPPSLPPEAVSNNTLAL